MMSLKTHVGFPVGTRNDIGSMVLTHFSELGYRATHSRPSQWVFHRGNKLAAFWRFDIRAYATTLTVSAFAQQDGTQWLGCDWDLYTCGNLTTGGDVATLEAEGRSLETLLKRQA
jgi:hypothetical protein